MNLVLLMADQLSACWLELAMSGACPTPNLTRLAARGVRFTRCISHNPVCMPARASLLTGRSSRVHGVLLNGYELDPAVPTFPQALQRAGFSTTGVGKFHLQCHNRSAHNDVRPYGFDHAEVTEDIRAGDWLDWVGEAYPRHYEAALATVWPVPCLEAYGRGRRNLLPEVRAAAARHRPGYSRAYPSVVPEECMQTRWVGERTAAAIASAREPFFVSGSFVDPHDPYDPPERLLETVRLDAIPPPICPAWPHDPDAPPLYHRSEIRRAFAGVDGAEWVRMRQHYLASVAFIDEEVGRVLSALEAAGVAERTWVVFTADHGDMLGDHGLPMKGAWHYDACVRVPLIVAGPGCVHCECSAPVETLDLFPTVLELCGASPEPSEGRSLAPWLRGGRPAAWRSAAYAESYATYDDTEPDGWSRTLRSVGARYTYHPLRGGEMLFNLQDDSREVVNLVRDSAYAELLGEFRSALFDRCLLQEDPLPTRSAFRLPWH